MAVSLSTLTDRELLKRYHEQGDASAREALVQRHLPLVRSLARRYAGRGKAIDRYELSREVALTTYATPNVVGEIKRHFRDKGWAIRVPRALQELNGKMGPTIERLTAKLGRSPSIAEIANEFQTTPEPALQRLPPREREILRMRFEDGLTQTQIAERVGISQMHVSRLIRRSLDRMREQLG